MRFTPGRKSYTVLSLATKRSWKDSSGKWQSRTEWHRAFASYNIQNCGSKCTRRLPDSKNLTALLAACQQGNASARDELIAVVYDELRRLAARYLRAERRDHTLEPTALVHELYVRLFATSAPIRSHFFAVAAHTLRRILVDYARTHQAKKRGGAHVRLSLTAAEAWAEERSPDLVALDDALSELSQLHPRAAQVVELRFFAGLQENEVAKVLDLAPVTVKRDWKIARAWLLSRLAARDQA